jgi:transketolase
MRTKKITKKELLYLEKLCRETRRDILLMAHNAKSPHIGPALSCVEILTALYQKIMNIDHVCNRQAGRDRFILSKGHAAMALYSCLSHAGFFKIEKMSSYCKNGSDLAEHPLANGLPGIEFATGSLGHGLSIGIGLSVASRLKRILYNVYVLMGDGETNEGSVWEAAGLASTLKLQNLIGVIDRNNLQATDAYNRLSGGYSLKEAWKSFGWQVYEVDGHDLAEIVRIFDEDFYKVQKPKIIIANTVKGKGISFMENSLEWHYRSPSTEDLKKAFAELDAFKPRGSNR